MCSTLDAGPGTERRSSVGQTQRHHRRRAPAPTRPRPSRRDGFTARLRPPRRTRRTRRPTFGLRASGPGGPAGRSLTCSSRTTAAGRLAPNGGGNAGAFRDRGDSRTLLCAGYDNRGERLSGPVSRYAGERKLGCGSFHRRARERQAERRQAIGVVRRASIEPMPHPVDFVDAHRRHWGDAELLFDHDRWANADQLYGFSAECGLKAVMRTLGMHRRHERYAGTGASRAWAEALVDLREVRGRPGGARLLRSLPVGVPFSDWSQHDRYADRMRRPTRSPRTPGSGTRAPGRRPRTA